jgi:hypothetical protein
MSLEASLLLLAWLAIALLAFGMAGIVGQLRRSAEPARRVALGPELGTAVPPLLELARPTGGAILYFMESQCDPCHRLLAAIERHGDSRGEFILTPSTPGTISAAGVPVLPDQSDLFEALDIPATPYGVAIDARGAVAQTALLSSEVALETFLRQAPLRGPRKAPAVEIVSANGGV